MPVAMQKNKVFIILFGARREQRVQVRQVLRHDPDGAEHQALLHRRLLRRGRGAEPQARDGRADRRRMRSSPSNVCEGARENATKAGLKIVYDKTYPPTTTDFTPIVRAIQATNPDVVAFCSYPLDSVGHGQIGQRDRLQAEDDRRRHGRPAGDRLQEPARPAAQRLHQLRDLGAGQEDDVRGHQRVPGEVPGRAPRPRASIRWATTWAAGAMPTSRCSAGDQGRQQPQGRRARRLHPQDHVQDHHGASSSARTASGPKGRMLQVQYHGIKRATASSRSGAWTTRPC